MCAEDNKKAVLKVVANNVAEFLYDNLKRCPDFETWTIEDIDRHAATVIREELPESGEGKELFILAVDRLKELFSKRLSASDINSLYDKTYGK